MKKILRVGSMLLAMAVASTASAQLGKRTPSEKKVVPDPVTGVPLTFLTSGPSGDNTLYQTHMGWTADRKWIIFRSSDRNPGQGAQGYAVNEETGVIVQITEGGGNGFGSGALNVAQKSMKVYYTRNVNAPTTLPGPAPVVAAAPAAADAAPATQPGGRRGRGGGGGGGNQGPVGVYELDLAKLLADSEAGTVKSRDAYERLCGQLPVGVTNGGGFGLDADEQIAYLGVRGGDVGQYLPPNTKIEGNSAGGGLGAGPAGIRKMDLKTGKITPVIDVGFQIGHMQANPFTPGEIIYCWETRGKAPVRAWVVNADGTNNRPVFAEADFDWVTHETVIGKDEVSIGILGHRNVGRNDDWGPSGTREHPTGIAVVNLRTKQMMIEGQTPTGSVWHVNGSWDGRWLCADDFQRSIWVWDRNSMERTLISTGHKPNAADHPHPIFDPTGTKILVQSAMIYSGDRTESLPHDLCIIPLPEKMLKRTYSQKLVD